MTSPGPLENITPDEFESMLVDDDGPDKLDALMDKVLDLSASHIKTGIPEDIIPDLPPAKRPCPEDEMVFNIDDLIPVKADPIIEPKKEVYTPPASEEKEKTTTISVSTDDREVKPSKETLKKTQPIAQKKGTVTTDKVDKKETKSKGKKPKLDAVKRNDKKDEKTKDPKLREVDQDRLEKGLKERQKRVSELFDDKGNVT